MKRVPSSSNVLYDVSPDDLGTLHSSRADFAPFPTVEIDTLRVSSENILLSDPNASSYDQPLNDSKLLASPFSSTSTSAQKALPQPKPSTASSKKKKTRKPTAADPAIEKSAANPKRKTNKHSTSLPVNAFQPTLTTTLKGPKSPKSPRNIKPRFDDISASADTATNTTVPGTRPFLQKKRDSSFSSDHSLFADTAVPTCPASHLVSAQNGSKKLKKPLLSKKKFFEQTAAPQQLTAHNKTSTESLQQVIEEKGFKLVKKKFKKKKSLSVDSSMDKSVTVARPPVPATQNVMVKVNNAPKTTSLEVEDRKGSVSSVWRAPLLESDNQDISDIMDAALHNISELSDNDDNADINRYSSPVSSNSSCPSPVSVKWPLDNRYFGNNGISSPLISGVAELNSFQQPSPWSPKPEDNFPLNHYNQGACYPVNGFASSPVPQAVSPISMYPPQSLLSAVDRHLVVSTAAATSLTPTVKRSNTRVTNSTLTWSVPDHLRSHLRNF